MQIYEFCFVSRKQLCYCSLFRFGNIRFVFELSNKKAASLAGVECDMVVSGISPLQTGIMEVVITSRFIR